MPKGRIIRAIAFLLAPFFFCGCQLLALPAQVIGGTFDLLGKAVQAAGNMPMPPPGIFF